jgi:L-2-amino-thiazoline-4-carboxylic acid hydrolase
MPMHNIIISLMKPFINASARRVLTPRFTAGIANAMLNSAWREYRILRKEPPREQNFGARIMVGLAVVSEAFFRQLAGKVSEQEAWRIFNEIAWAIYSKMGRAAYRLTGLASKNKYQRLLNATRLFRAFPFSSPSYRWNDLPAEPGMVAFNCERCPVANYFKMRKNAPLGKNTWCQLDYDLAKLWGGSLALTNTLAGGAEVCDFRWKAG